MKVMWLQLIIQMRWCGVTLERAAPGDIYPSYATDQVLHFDSESM